MKSWCVAIFIGLTLATASVSAGDDSSRWWKGNLHTHSLWSDGDDYPEMISAWYKEQGYHFLAISDHNVLAVAERWISSTNRGGGQALEKYLQRFGPDWVEIRTNGAAKEIRLKPLNEYRALLEEAGKFLLIQSEEISDHFNKAPIHLNATNLRDFLPPAGGNSVVEVMQNNVNAVLEQRKRTGQPMFPHLNHPNFGYAITAEELLQVEGERFFEVYNGHPHVHNEGNATHASTEKVWDIILAARLSSDKPVRMLGVATDDSHHYHKFGTNQSNAGRGWVMVQAKFLTPEQIIKAMEAGQFYASTGVTLKSIERSGDKYTLVIDGKPGVEYRTEFIGTRRGYPTESEPVRNEKGEELRVTRRYSPEIGTILAEATGLEPSYQFKGDELYVRAKVISTAKKTNGNPDDEFELAWTQPEVK